MNIGLISNVNTDIIKQIFSKEYQVFSPDGYAGMLQCIISEKSALYEYQPEVVIILIDGHEATKSFERYDECEEELTTYLDAIAMLRQRLPECLLLVSSIDIQLKRIKPLSLMHFERKLEWFWYESLSRVVRDNERIYILDLKEMVEEMGREHFYSSKMWYAGSIPYSLIASKKIVERSQKIMESYQGARYKCLALDLDNTLWGGVLGEDGIEGIKLSQVKEGSVYYDLQKRIKEIKNTGVVLAILSKNNHEDVLKALDGHPNMILKSDDFVGIYANWDEKSQNIQKLAKELNIGIDSFVFFDDNPLEREAMKIMQPQVVVVNFPKDITQLEKNAIDIYERYFLSFKTTKEDSQKTDMYKAELVRKQKRDSFISIEDYIKSLEISISIHKLRKEEVERTAQLTQKTNQFNVTTKRYTPADIIKLAKSDSFEIYTCSASDKYGDSGLVSVLIIEYKDSTAYIDTFLMSCRVMGRTIENSIIQRIEDILVAKQKKLIKATYFPTAKNEPVAFLFEKLGFDVEHLNQDGSKNYCKILSKNTEKLQFMHVNLDEWERVENWE